MIIVCLRSNGCISWVRGIIVLPTNIHKAVKKKTGHDQHDVSRETKFSENFITRTSQPTGSRQPGETSNRLDQR